MSDRKRQDPSEALVPDVNDPVEQRLQGLTPGDAPAAPVGHRPPDDLLPVIADELRVPSAILLRQSRALRRAAGETLPAGATKALALLEEQARRLGELARSMREVDALARARPLEHEPVDLDALVDGFVRAQAPAARARGVRLERAPRADPGPLVVSGDAERIARALDAAVDALRRPLGRGGSLRLSVHPTAQGARIAVEARQGPAGRARRSSKPRPGGAALALARKVAQLHGGILDVTAGERTLSVSIELPTSPPGAEPQPRANGADGKARLLVVDDDADAREALSMMLGDDYDVLLAADGREALERAAADRPDIVLMDLYMPRMDGLAALEAMRADASTEDVPVILVSARGDDLTRSRSLDLGAVDFLQKPFSGRELKARVERTLRLTRRESELQTLARTDPLTGLANLRAFRSRLDEEVKRARRYHTALSCVMVDMDNLKPINDQLGHAAGDQAIRAVAEVLRRELRQTDFGARYGGDEFVLLLPHTSGVEARVFAERVCSRLRASPLDLGARSVPLAASFGISALGDEPLDDAGETLVRRADAALYAAKRGGRSRVAAHPSADADGDEDQAVPLA